MDERRDTELAAAPGYLQIAEKPKLRHGTSIGSDNVPCVAACDWVLRIGTPPNDRIVLWNVKPAAKLNTARISSTWRRIRLAQEHAHQVKAHHFNFHDNTAPGRLLELAHGPAFSTLTSGGPS